MLEDDIEQYGEFVYVSAIEEVLEELHPIVEKFYCKSCEEFLDMDYIGTQKMDDEKIFDLYNCSKCHNTTAQNITQYYKDNYEV